MAPISIPYYQTIAIVAYRHKPDLELLGLLHSSFALSLVGFVLVIWLGKWYNRAR